MTWRNEGFAKIIEQLPLGVAVTLPGGTLEYANPCLCDLLGIHRDAAAGAPLARFIPGGNEQRAADSFPRIGEKRLRRHDGETCDVLESVYALHDDAGRITHFIHLVQDLRLQKQLDSLSSLAFYDHLTALPNRHLLGDRLERTLLAARRKRTAFALLYIDIDHFKHVNDTFGHEAGDELLRQFAFRVGRALRRSDSVGRWGGDEFVALLEDIGDPRIAAGVGQQLLKLCDVPYRLGGNLLHITLSVGMSFYPRDGDDVQTLLRAADRAMYAVKTNGRGGCRIAESAIASYAPRRSDPPPGERADQST